MRSVNYKRPSFAVLQIERIEFCGWQMLVKYSVNKLEAETKSNKYKKFSPICHIFI